MAYKALIFGTDDLYPTLKPSYEAEVKRGNLEIAATAELEGDAVNLVYADGKRGAEDVSNFDLAIISSANDFYRRMKLLEAQGFSQNKIIDGRVFQVPALNFPRLVKEGIAYGAFDTDFVQEKTHSIHTRIYTVNNKRSLLILGKKSYITDARIEGCGIVSVNNFSSLSWNLIFELRLNGFHNPANISSHPPEFWDWIPSKEFFPPLGTCRINIGSDVWIGRGCILKCTNPNKPLIIGDSAVIASDSVVVKNVPPYAIVGGNPAQIIKYRFPPKVIKALLRIKWWDWNLDKIHDNFKYFNDVKKFISLHDK